MREQHQHQIQALKSDLRASDLELQSQVNLQRKLIFVILGLIVYHFYTSSKLHNEWLHLKILYLI